MPANAAANRRLCPCVLTFRLRHLFPEDKLMDLLHIIIVLIVVGVILGLINRFIPMASSIKSILNGVVVICVVLWLLQVFGILGSINNIKLH